MGAVIYARLGELEDASTSISLVCSKSRITPLKRVTLARLELCAAYTLSLLLQAVLDGLRKRFPYITALAFSDSTVALS